ncbi:MAG: aspartate--tRNA ligase [Clostridia bacterium]|nr:aspartate--tRNA ligase [Clostridia bacterium]MBQ1435245.1 aspartate--tRNA ligase [Clostridia bacterium]
MQKRTHYCGGFRMADVGTEAVLYGWVQKQRDIGSLIFIDLRDRTGICQVVFEQETVKKEYFDLAFTLRSEYVICVTGKIRERSNKNPNIPTGDVELLASGVELLSKAQTPPFEIVENSDVNDNLRLQYRYLDLRRPDMQRKIMLRHRISKIARDYYDENGFLEIETPMLQKSTPEGARDYLVPSRVKNGSFYALPQSPQLYKQILMISGFDRYFQIARCFRDEDLRADRQPEFTQIDIEMSFVDAEDVMTANEGFIKRVFKEVLNVELNTPFLRMPYREAMERFGSDKPDTRFGFELKNISDIVKDCGFGVFKNAIEAGGSVRAINVSGYADKISRKEIDSLGEFVKTYRAKGLAWMKVTKDGVSSPVAKFLSEDVLSSILAAMDAHENDLLLFVADKDKVVFDALGALRCEVARRLDILDAGTYNFLWVTEFPLLEYDEEEGRYVAMHHPFTAPMDEDVEYLDTDPGRVRAKAYDIVLNGVELGGGSIRIFREDMQEKMFSVIGLSKETAAERFGFLLEAFKYGAPPHGGMAYGLDRLVMLMTGSQSIRDVIAFPKVQNASELMSGAPDTVDEKQLDELGIAIIAKAPASEE